MGDVTLDKARCIARAINTYAEKHDAMDYNTLVLYVEKQTKATRAEISEVVEFLQELQPERSLAVSSEPATDISTRVATFLAQKMDLGRELHYNYAVARSLLDMIMNRGNVPDSEEVRKTLREISRFAESMLKMQERVYNLQRMQEFQTRVLEILEELAPDARDIAVARLLEAEL